MIITNKFKLPQTLVDAVTFADKHWQGDYSVTGLPKGAKQVWLTKRHDDKIEVDVSERLWALFGTAIHYVLDKGDDKNVLKEEKLEAIVAGKKLTGIADHFDGKIISDWKFTSAWAVVYESSYADFEKQLNCYAFMYTLLGFHIEAIQACLLLKDWSRMKAKEDPHYPQCQMKIVPLKLWTEAEQKAYIKERIIGLERYKDTPDDKIPECTPEQRWHKDDKWAVMKGKNKRATRVLDTEEEAHRYLEGNEGPYVIKYRPGKDTKCIDYCDCNTFCNYWKAIYGEK